MSVCHLEGICGFHSSTGVSKQPSNGPVPFGGGCFFVAFFSLAAGDKSSSGSEEWRFLH